MPNLFFDRFESTWPLVGFERADVTRHSKHNVNISTWGARDLLRVGHP